MLPEKILFCTDFSENSEPAKRLAMDYAKGFGAKLLILHVVDASAFPAYSDWMTPSIAEELNRILASTHKSAEERLISLAQECASEVKEVRTFCRVGSAPKDIVALAAEEAVDLIVLGTHGRTGVKHLVMGSVARSVLKTAHRPVLIVEGPATDQ